MSRRLLPIESMVASVVPPATRGMTANELTARLILEIPKRFPGAWLYRNNRISAKAVGKGGKLRHVSAGIDGQGDLSGVVPITYGGKLFGVRCEIEVKIGRDKMSAVQMSFRAKILSLGAIYIEARDVDSTLAQLAEIIKDMES